MKRPRAYLVTVREFVVIAHDERDLRETASMAITEGGFQSKALTPEELRAWGDTYPVGDWDPDRELTCAEIADEMAAYLLTDREAE